MSLLRSITARLVISIAVAALLVFSVLGYALDRELGIEQRGQQIEQLNTKFQDINYILTRARDSGLWPRIHAKLDALTPPDGSTRYWLLSDDPQIRYGQALAEISSFSQGAGRVGELRIADHAEPMLIRSAYYPASPVHAALRFIVSVDSTPYAYTRRAFRSVMATTFGAAMVLMAGLGYWIARWGLLPVRRMSKAAHALSPSALSQRLAVSPMPDELANLAHSFNGALDRLEAAYQQLESFNADVTHELRTPLTNLIGQTQVALSRERSVAHLEEVLQSNLEDLERLRGIINDMLFLARADQGERPQHLRLVSLDAEVEKAGEFLDFLMEEAQVTLSVRGDVQATVDSSLLGRAITNLLHNAIQYSPKQSEIVVELTADERYARLMVSNPGPKIAPEHLGRLFDRFYRVDSSRTNSGQNHGLGLAIVKAVADMHGGQVFASSQDGINRIGFSVAVS